MREEPYLEALGVSKAYQAVPALRDVALCVRPGEIVCLLGDNGAGKSTLIQILSGVMQPDSGRLRVAGQDVRLRSPGHALDLGIATVFQDLAIVPMMPVYRNFFLGREPSLGWGPFRHFDHRQALSVASQVLEEFGVEADAMRRPIGALSGGQRQSIAVARAMHFGARVLILDEPTSALGVRQAETVLGQVRRAKAKGVGVILITHNVSHAYLVGDTFNVLHLGRPIGRFKKAEISELELMRLMGGNFDPAAPILPGGT